MEHGNHIQVPKVFIKVDDNMAVLGTRGDGMWRVNDLKTLFNKHYISTYFVRETVCFSLLSRRSDVNPLGAQVLESCVPSINHCLSLSFCVFCHEC